MVNHAFLGHPYDLGNLHRVIPPILGFTFVDPAAALRLKSLKPSAQDVQTIAIGFLIYVKKLLTIYRVETKYKDYEVTNRSETYSGPWESTQKEKGSIISRSPEAMIHPKRPLEAFHHEVFVARDMSQAVELLRQVRYCSVLPWLPRKPAEYQADQSYWPISYHLGLILCTVMTCMSMSI